MSQSGYTPIQLYHSSTPAAQPVAGNLADGELAINIPDGKLYYKDGSTVKLLASSSSTGGTFTAPVVIEGSTSSAALRVTQTGSGNALLVEDEANPDSTPFVIDQAGRVFVGALSGYATAGLNPGVQVNGTGGISGIGSYNWSSTGSEYAALNLSRSMSNTVGTQTTVTADQAIGIINFNGSDGTSFVRAAQIIANCDGTPGTNDMPGRLVFSTTADGASSPTERMRINNAGNVSIGGTSTSTTLFVTGLIPSTGASTRAISNNGTIVPSTSTSSSVGYFSGISTQAASFTLPTLSHFYASQGTIGAGSTVTTQYGYFVENTLTGATNNYGFYGNIASGTGRYNLYMNGTADNYIAGNVGIGQAPATGWKLTIGGNITGATTANQVIADGIFQSDVTAIGRGFCSVLSTQAAAFTLANMTHYLAYQSTVGAGSTVTNQYGFNVDSTLTGATNNYGFFGNIASGTGRYNLYMNGTAANYFGGQIQLGQDYIEKTYTANSSTAITLDLTNGTDQVITLTGSPTITMPTAVAGKSFLLKLKTGTGSFTVTWTTVKWPGGTAPTVTSTASKMDIYSFFSDGTNWYGTTVGQNYTP